MKYAQKPEPKEADITRSIRNYLKSRGIFHWKVRQGLGCEKGISDILGCYNGRLLAIEVKTMRGKLSEHQDRFIKRVIGNGGIAFVARSVDDVIINLRRNVHLSSSWPPKPQRSRTAQKAP